MPNLRKITLTDLWLLATTLLLVVGLAACRQSAGGVPLNQPANSPETKDPAPDVRMTVAPASTATPVIGPFQWNITLFDSDGAPIEDATVTVRGDMNHAGMVPVEATADYQGEGVYTATMDWTMAGDWFVTVTAALADGREKATVVEITVAFD